MTEKKVKTKKKAAPKTLAEKLAARIGNGVRFSAKDDGGIVEVIPTGIDVIDHYALGCGGLPVGRISELYSGEGVGKTTLTYHFMGAVQRAGGVAIHADTENSWDPARAELMGVDLSQLIRIVDPKETEGDSFLSMEEVLDRMNQILSDLKQDEGPVLIAWDSVASANPESDLDPKVSFKDNARVGAQARVMSRAVRVLNTLLSKRRAHLLYVNQTRAKIGGLGFGPKTTTTGGNALKFYTSSRFELRFVGAVKQGVHHVGRDLVFTPVKSRTTIPFRKVTIRLDYLEGFDNEKATIDLAKDFGLLPKGSRVTRTNYEAAIAALHEKGWSPL